MVLMMAYYTYKGIVWLLRQKPHANFNCAFKFEQIFLTRVRSISASEILPTVVSRYMSMYMSRISSEVSASPSGPLPC
jgi:hypothetical protein